MFLTQIMACFLPNIYNMLDLFQVQGGEKGRREKEGKSEGGYGCGWACGCYL